MRLAALYVLNLYLCALHAIAMLSCSRKRGGLFQWRRGAMSVSDMDDSLDQTTSMHARTAVHDPAVQSRSLKVIQRSLVLQ